MKIEAAVIGGDKLKKKFAKFDKRKDVVLDELVVDTAAYVQKQAKNYARSRTGVGTGHLHQNIKFYKNADQLASVVSEAPYSGYVEFGTGRQVKVPPEFSEIAAKIRKRKGGSFKKGLRSIEDWCGRVGIDKKAAYPIFMSILRKGLRPRPFMYPAYLKGRRRLIVEAKKRIDKFVKNY